MAKFAFWGFHEVRCYKLPHSGGALTHRAGAERRRGVLSALLTALAYSFLMFGLMPYSATYT